MEHLLDFELARGLQVRAAAARFGEHRSGVVGEQAHRLRAAGIDSQHVHRCHYGTQGLRAQLSRRVQDFVDRPIHVRGTSYSSTPSRQQAFPAAVVEVGDATRPLWSGAFGRLSYATGRSRRGR